MRAILTLLGLAIIAVATSVPGPVHDLLVRDWMKAGVIFVPVALMLAWFARRQPSGAIPAVALVGLAIYLLHQGEEHWIDALGRTFAFQGFANAQVARLLPDVAAPGTPLTALAIFTINVGVWLLALQGATSRPGDAFPLTAGVAATLVNGMTHVGAALALGLYNPGLVTAVILFLPLSAWALAWLVRAGHATLPHVGLAMAWAVCLHAFLFGSMVAANVYGLIPEVPALFLFLLWGILPTAVAPHLRTAG